MNKKYLYGLLATVIPWGAFFIYIWHKVFVYNKTGIRLWAYMAWDWPAHFAYAMWFAKQPAHLWFSHHPLFYQGSFSYPFVADAIAGLLVRMHAPFYATFYGLSIITTLVLLCVLYSFYYYILRSWPWATLATSIFLTSGGFGFVYFCKDIAAHGLLQTLSSPFPFYTFLEHTNISWLNIVISELLPQRAFLLGIPCTLLIVIRLARWVRKNFSGISTAERISLGIISGLLPAVHLHSYMALLCTAFILFLQTFTYWRAWLLYIIPAALTSCIPIFLLYHSPLNHSSFKTFFTLHFGVHVGPFHTPLTFLGYWLLNWGLFGITVCIAMFWKQTRNSTWFIAGSILFIIGNTIQLQPYAWDNRKILVWSYLLLTLPVVTVLQKLWNKNRTAKIVTVVSLILIMLTGIIDIFRMLAIQPDKDTTLVYSQEQLDLAAAIQKLTPPDAFIVSSDDQKSPIPALTGSQVPIGFSGLVAPFDFPYRKTLQDMRSIQHGGPNTCELLKKYTVAYVVLGPQHSPLFWGDTYFFTTHFQQVFVSPQYQVYNTIPGC